MRGLGLRARILRELGEKFPQEVSEEVSRREDGRCVVRVAQCLGRWLATGDDLDAGDNRRMRR